MTTECCMLLKRTFFSCRKQSRRIWALNSEHGLNNISAKTFTPLYAILKLQYGEFMLSSVCFLFLMYIYIYIYIYIIYIRNRKHFPCFHTDQSINSPYCIFKMAYNGVDVSIFPYSYRNTAFSQSKLAFSKCYFINRSRYFSLILRLHYF